MNSGAGLSTLTKLQQGVPAEQMAFTSVFSYLDLKLLGKGLVLDTLVPRVGIFLYYICFLYQLHGFFFPLEGQSFRIL